MKIVFVADAHLKGRLDPDQEGLASFLDGLAGVDMLVMLGDFFEVWTGANDVVLTEYGRVIESLRRLKDRGVKIICLEGNHDFNMAGFFAGALGADVYPGSYEGTLAGVRVYMAHGDRVGAAFGYRLWRWYLRSPLFRFMAYVAGPKAVWDIGMGMSRRSRGYSDKGELVEAKLRVFAQEKIDDGFGAVALAHSHKAGVSRLGNGVYANPGSWAGAHSYLVLDDGAWRVERHGLADKG
ncbi:MAG: UDP-2,3-diacylglucosamine diphosphatase [Deltaproteobacteria bacterium]|nr:UDP-2,3-diacylglucosamine diphosphatase [Deltaproteobacteria bacterium]